MSTNTLLCYSTSATENSERLVSWFEKGDISSLYIPLSSLCTTLLFPASTVTWTLHPIYSWKSLYMLLSGMQMRGYWYSTKCYKAVKKHSQNNLSFLMSSLFPFCSHLLFPLAFHFLFFFNLFLFSISYGILWDYELNNLA